MIAVAVVMWISVNLRIKLHIVNGNITIDEIIC